MLQKSFVDVQIPSKAYHVNASLYEHLKFACTGFTNGTVEKGWITLLINMALDILSALNFVRVRN
jgi:hypothetical protein